MKASIYLFLKIVKRALEQLYILKALDNQGKITTLGRKMAEFPLEPAYATVLISSQVYIYIIHTYIYIYILYAYYLKICLFFY